MHQDPLTDEQEDILLHNEYPQPFQHIVEGYDNASLGLLKRQIEIKRKDLENRMQDLGEDSDHFIRCRDKRRWLWKKLMHIDSMFAVRNAAQREADKDRKARITAMHESERLAKLERRVALTEKLNKKPEKTEATYSPKPKPIPVGGTVCSIVWYSTQRLGHQVAFTTLTETADWFLSQVENLPEYDHDLIPLDVRFRGLNQSQYDRLPEWLKPAAPVGS